MCSSRASMRTGNCMAGTGAFRARVALPLSLAAILLGGCSSAAPLPNSGLVSAFVSTQPRQAPLPVDLEADGREAQRPPPVRMFQRPDDPTQPFSPNYGGVPLPEQPEEAAPPAKV